MTPGHLIVDAAFARGLQPDPNMTVDQWSDEYMIIPKDSGANEYGKYRTSRTPHARKVMLALSDNHPCKRVALMGASQMLKTQVGLNWFACSVHQSPANFLWILPTGKLAKRTSTRISKTISAVPELVERVAAPRSRDSVNTLDTKEYIGGSLFIVTAGAAANLSEVPARRVLFDEVDRAEANVNGEGDPVALAEARQTTFERNRKAYYPSSPTISGESIIEKLYLRGTQHVALAECVHCGHAQPLEFERLQMAEDGQSALYSCIDCGEFMTETDKSRMFVNGLWSDGIEGDGETISFTINAMFLPYGWLPWIALLREYSKAKAKLDEGSEESMIAFYNTRLARCWERSKEQTKYDALMARAEPYTLGRVPAQGLILTAAIDTQNDRLELKVVAWGEGMECWIIDYQVILSSPAEDATWEKADQLLKITYRHASGQMMKIEAAFVDSGGSHTQDVYNFTYSKKHRNIFAIKGASRPDRPILCAKPTIVDITFRGKTERRGAQLWFIGTDTAKDYLASRWQRSDGAGAVHFSQDLSEDYYKQLTAEYRTSLYKNGRKVSRWEKKQADRNEALDLMVYNLAAAYHLGLHKRTEGQWQRLREKLNPLNQDMFVMLEAEQGAQTGQPQNLTGSAASNVPSTTPPAAPQKESLIAGGRISLVGTRRGRR
jgi:phage terminase large subunit GpA-like protein